MSSVEHLVDLDVLADRLQPLIEERKSGSAVGPLTWRDETSPWPQPITPERSRVQVPESLGFRLQRHDLDDVFDMVVWIGGWADVEYLSHGDVHVFCPEFRDVDGALAAVRKQVEDFLA